VPAKFVLKKGSTGKFRFNLLATNGQVVATSEAYESKRAALGGINSIKKSAADAEIDDQTSGSANGSSSSTRTATSKKPAAKAEKSSSKADKSSASKDKKSDKASQASKESKSRGSSTSKKSKPKKDHDASDTGQEMELGLCHYGGEGEEATTMAVRTDGTGWIAVCDEHKKDAEQDGFKVNK
jgi:uncharacterized protein YegP (UPF0339 family)